MSKAYKTSQKKRTNYIYYPAEGGQIVITPGENGVTEADIELLHSIDDNEVDEQRRYNYRVTAHLDAYKDKVFTLPLNARKLLYLPVRRLTDILSVA